MGVIKQFLTDVNWGDLDYLIIDLPPGTGDEPLSLCQLIQPLTGAVIVTTPQKVAAVDVRKSISFCRRLSVPVLGVVENMSGFVCPKCGELTQILPEGGGRKIAADMKVPSWGPFRWIRALRNPVIPAKYSFIIPRKLRRGRLCRILSIKSPNPTKQKN